MKKGFLYIIKVTLLSLLSLGFNFSLKAQATNTITTGTVVDSPICACSSPNSSFNVSFTSTGTFNAGNIYYAQLSDSSGSFTSADTIGMDTLTSNSGEFAVTIPCNTPSGQHYEIRIISSNPSVIGSDNGAPLVITGINSPSISIAASSTAPICTGGTVHFLATVSGTVSPSYQWQVDNVNAGTDSLGFVATLTNSTTTTDTAFITCVLTSASGCASSVDETSSPVGITVLPAAPLTFTPADVIMCTGTPVQITVSGAVSYVWTPAQGLSCTNCAAPFVNATVTTEYIVTGTTGNCISTDNVVVAVICPENFVPTAFSPNGDGINDVLTVLGPQISNFDFKIYNRWGQMVFESTNQDFGWDGTFKSEPAPIGVYVWELSGTDVSGGKVLIQGKNSGSVTLIR